MAKPSCFIMGYGSGVGHGVAKAFGSAGFSLGLLARNTAKSTESVKELTHAGYEAELFAADAGNESSLVSGIDLAITRFGQPEVLVYNAFAFRQATPTKLTSEELISDFRVNVAGALIAANRVIPAMKARRSGAVLITGGGWALYPSAGVSSIAIGKAGLRHLALMLAEELQGSGVRAGTVTIMGAVAAGTPFDPNRIGQEFLKMVQQPDDQFQPEIQFTGG